MLRASQLRLAGSRGAYRFIMRHRETRALAWRYVAGEELADGIAIAQALNMRALGVRVRLCKGVYLEPREVAYPRKADVDAAFARLAEALLLRGTYPAVATHDERLIRHVQDVVRTHGIGPERFEFRLLFGIRRDLQMGLARQGYRVRVYLPYGKEWYPYLMRRLAERPSNLAFVVQSFLREAAVGRRGR